MVHELYKIASVSMIRVCVSECKCFLCRGSGVKRRKMVSWEWYGANDIFIRVLLYFFNSHTHRPQIYDLINL